MPSNIFPATDESIARAAALLVQGELVAFPTETVYGLGADVTNDRAVARIYEAKQRPSFNPLIVHVTDAAMAARYAHWNPSATALAERFWPGALTLVLPRLPDAPLSELATAGMDTVALRAPAHPVARALIERAGRGIVAPSANRSGRISPTRAQHVVREFGDTLALVLDGGECAIGVESTVLDLSGDLPMLLRPGAVLREEIEATLGRKVAVAEENAGIKAPGMMQSHYAPSLPVRLNALAPLPTEALLAFGAGVPLGARHMLNLSERGDVREAAANLFSMLRELDRPEIYTAIATMPIPMTGIGIAINDRLRRAASRH